MIAPNAPQRLCADYHGPHSRCPMCRVESPFDHLQRATKQVVATPTAASPRSLSLVLPYPPSMNHYWRHVGPKVLISREGRKFRTAVRNIIVRADVEPLDGELSVDVGVHPPDRRRRDLDNVLKSLLDALQHGGAYRDDSAISTLLVRRLDVVKDGSVVVTVSAARAATGGGDA